MFKIERKVKVWTTMEFLNENIDPEQFKKDVVNGMSENDLIEKYGDVNFSYDPNTERALSPKENGDEPTTQIFIDNNLIWDNDPDLQ